MDAGLELSNSPQQSSTQKQHIYRSVGVFWFGVYFKIGRCRMLMMDFGNRAKRDVLFIDNIKARESPEGAMGGFCKQ